jgi:hypothetical protein
MYDRFESIERYLNEICIVLEKDEVTKLIGEDALHDFYCLSSLVNVVIYAYQDIERDLNNLKSSWKDIKNILDEEEE